MITRPDYRAATNAAYQLIADNDKYSLSTNVFEFAQRLPKCRLFTYGQAVIIYGINRDSLLASSEYGFTITDGTRRIILYNEDLPLSCVRFTVAHEIGHAVLGHINSNDPIAEKESNCFARNLLCPIPIAKAYDLKTPFDYSDLFDVSEQMAQVTIEWRGSDEYYIDPKFNSLIMDKLYAYLCGFASLDEYMHYMIA